MNLNLDKRNYGIYFVTTVIAACFVFMFVSTVLVMQDIGNGKTSGDLAREKAKKECESKNGEYVRVHPDNPVNMRCIVNGSNN